MDLNDDITNTATYINCCNGFNLVGNGIFLPFIQISDFLESENTCMSLVIVLHHNDATTPR